MPTPNDPNLPLIEAARAHIADGRLAEAATVLNQARTQAPSDPRVFMMGALMAEKADNISGAFQLMERGLALAPNWAPGIMEVAELQARQGQFAEAAENAATALTLEPANPAILEGALHVALMTGQSTLAIRHLQQLLAQEPGNTSWRTLLATSLGQADDHDKALEIWDSLIAEFPGNQKFLEGRLHARLALGQLQQAGADSAALLALDPGNPIYAYYDARAHGQSPAHQPPELSRDLFDRAAFIFDQQLVQGLRYDLPRQVANKLLALHPKRNIDFLDLGCGTGLLAAQLGKLQGRMVGVDISPKMLERARRYGLYDELQAADLHTTLRDGKPGSWNVIAALDVCVYVGDISDLARGVFDALAPDGRWVFSCETAPEDGPDLHLNPATERYAHKRSAVERQCRTVGFVVDTEAVTVRYQKGSPVPGFLVWARKPV